MEVAGKLAVVLEAEVAEVILVAHPVAVAVVLEAEVVEVILVVHPVAVAVSNTM